MGFDFDGPCVSIGIGRPGLGTMGVFGTASRELVFNVTFNTDADWCINGSTTGAISVGGEINTLVWSSERVLTIATSSGPSVKKGQGCTRSEEHTSELQSRGHLVCRLLLEKKK